MGPHSIEEILILNVRIHHVLVEVCERMMGGSSLDIAAEEWHSNEMEKREKKVEEESEYRGNNIEEEEEEIKKYQSQKEANTVAHRYYMKIHKRKNVKCE